MAKSPRSHHEPCGCGACPQLPADRPPTKRECVEHWTHQYGARWPRRKVLRYAIGTFTFYYALWVNTRGWRNPPDWSGGRVPLSKQRRAGEPMTPTELNRWTHELTTEMERRLEDAATARP